MSETNTQGTNSTQGTTQSSGLNTNQSLIDAINELSENVKDATEKKRQKYIFAPKPLSAIDINKDASEAEMIIADSLTYAIWQVRDKILQCGYEVEICEDIDIKEVKGNEKFYIRITGRNKSYIDIDFFEYKEECLDFNSIEYDYIHEHIEKLVGILNKKDKEVIPHIVEYISYVSYFKQEQQKVYRKVGWSNYDGVTIFKYDGIYSNNKIKGQCISSIKEALSPENYNKDDKDLWALQLVNVMQYSATASLIIAAGISGIFRQMLPYTKETNINMNVRGSRATGKSTISHFVLSFFGNPELLEGSFTDTENAMEVIRAERTVLPYILDERMLRLEGETEKTKRRTLIIDIFREYEGKVKERLGKQYEEVSGKRTCSPIISSSVDSMLGLIFDYGDIGQFRRFIEIDLESEKTLFESNKHAEFTEHVAYSCYGYGIEILMEYIFEKSMEDGEKIEKTFNEQNALIKKRLEIIEKTNNDMNNLQASSKRFALIVTSYIILKRALEDYFAQNYVGETNINGVKKDIPLEITDRAEDIADILIQNLVDKMKKVKQDINIRENALAFIDKFNDLLERNDKINWTNEGKYIGYLIESDDRYELYIRRNDICWLAVLKWDYDEEWLKNYHKEWLVADKGLKDKIRKRVEEMIGPLPSEKIAQFIEKHGKGKVEYAKVKETQWCDKITVYKKDYNAEGMKDSEEEEDNDTV